ncbi:MAG: hypothetical protein KAY37_15020 [Phycisphaerae bacterium]|nr:hypothetical protein [Phycisphaerae bacterium]
MARRRRPANLTDYRAVLDSTGDIAIGAYARQQRRRRILIAMAGIGLIGGAVWLYTTLRPSAEIDWSELRPVAVECVKCGHREVMFVKAGEPSFPLKCPVCQERACHKLWECRDCGYQFLNIGQDVVLECPKCHSRRVGTAETLAEPAAEE